MGVVGVSGSARDDTNKSSRSLVAERLFKKKEQRENKGRGAAEEKTEELKSLVLEKFEDTEKWPV